MTHSINPIASKIKQDHKGILSMILAVDMSVQKLVKIECKLMQISGDHNHTLADQADEYLKHNNKLLSIARDLVKRLIATEALFQNNAIETPQPKLLKQYKQEIEILDWMHFEVTKKYFSFINKNFETKVIRLAPMAA
ncbi:MAG: hypothetical protein AB8F74_03055 [Saprospiraceae bacterium]